MILFQSLYQHIQIFVSLRLCSLFHKTFSYVSFSPTKFSSDHQCNGLCISLSAVEYIRAHQPPVKHSSSGSSLGCHNSFVNVNTHVICTSKQMRQPLIFKAILLKWEWVQHMHFSFYIFTLSVLRSPIPSWWSSSWSSPSSPPWWPYTMKTTARPFLLRYTSPR